MVQFVALKSCQVINYLLCFWCWSIDLLSQKKNKIQQKHAISIRWLVISEARETRHCQK